MKVHVFIIALLLTVGCHHKHSHHHGRHHITEVDKLPKAGMYYEVTQNPQGDKELIPINFKKEKETNGQESSNR